MKIESSYVSMSGNRNLLEKYEKRESIRMWIGDEKTIDRDDLVKISEQAKTAQEMDDTYAHLSKEDRLKIIIIEAMLKSITGKDIKIRIPKMPKQNAEHPDMPNNIMPLQAPERQGWGVEYDYHESYSEKEKMSFEAEGIIKTIDGKEIKFTASLTMSREFMLQNNINLRFGDAKKIDPLVINFDNAGVRLTDAKFSFDLDSDGKKDSISFVSPNSGFLVLDKNNDGEINNGMELFGPSTGNGFAELAEYDSDGNQWIDESDFIFGKLKIWAKDSKGNGIFYSLKDKNIGAIYLGSVSAGFGIKDSQNILHGEVKSVGIYLKENGTAGTIQQIDMTA